MKEKRELPRNVDNTIKICSVMPLKNLLFVSPLVTAIGGMVLLEPSPFSLFPPPALSADVSQRI